MILFIVISCKKDKVNNLLHNTNILNEKFFTCICTCMCIHNVCICMYLYMYICICTLYMYMYVYIQCICICTCTCIRMCVTVYIHIYNYIIINTHGRFAIAFLPLTTRLSTELFEAVFNKKSSG